MIRRKFSGFVLAAIMAVALQACSYSIILSNKNGTPAASPVNTELGFYNGKQVIVIDTVVHLSLLKDGVKMINACPIGGFHSVEYKITFGAMLRNTFTFGKKKSIKVKYVCLKDQNQ